MALFVRVHFEVLAGPGEVVPLGDGHYDTAPLVDAIDKVLRSEFGPRVLTLSADDPGEYVVNETP